MTNFSKFLNIIYSHRKPQCRKADLFLKNLFISTGNEIFYTDDYYKRLFNGQKPLTDEIRSLIKNFRFEDVCSYLRNCIDERKLDLIMEEFDISKEDGKDFDIFCESLATKFQRFFFNCDNENIETVSEIYSLLMDKHGNGSIPFANEKALLEAKKYFMEAISAIASIKVNEELIFSRRPFENFYDSIYKLFKVYNTGCNRAGRQIRRRAMDMFLEKTDSDVKAYLRKITEPGSSPLVLEKLVLYQFYDNYTHRDVFLSEQIDLEDNEDDILKKKKELFHSFSGAEAAEIFFTEYVIFKEKNKKINLLSFVSDVIISVKNILNEIEFQLNSSFDYGKIDGWIGKVLNDLEMSNIQYKTDGFYNTREDRYEYYGSSEIFFGSESNGIIGSGESKFPISNRTWFGKAIIEGRHFKDVVYIQSLWQSSLWKDYNCADLMPELITLNNDNTIRWFMIPFPSIPKIYRKIQEASALAASDKMRGFIFCAICYLYPSKDESETNRLFNLPMDERVKEAKDDLLLTIGYRDGELYQFGLLKESAKKGEKPQELTEMPLFSLEPLIASILAWQKKR